MNEQQLIQQRQQQLAQVYQPQEQFIKQQQAALPKQFAGQRSALEQAKVNEFRDIGNRAQRQGMFFSGFRPSEEARYLGERFLPGMQDIESRQEQARLGLLERLIGLRAQKAESMVSFQDQLRKERLQREAEERAAQREMQMARMQAASRGGGGGGSKEPSVERTIASGLAANAGADGYVDPQTYKRAAQEWLAGRYGSITQFNKQFGRFINPTHIRDYLVKA